jgi:hypothetical protein
MRRLMCIAAFLVFAASLQLEAQRGGSHGSAGGHGGFAGHSSFGNHAFSGAHSAPSFAPHSYAGRRFFTTPLSSRGLHSRAFNRSGVGLRIRTYGPRFRSNCYGYGYGCGWGYGYPYLGGGVDPYWWWDSDSSYDQDQQNQMGLANEMNQQSLAEQQKRQQGDQDSYARYAPPAPREPERTVAAVPTVLIFRDQHQQEVENYAIVGQTVWVFAPQHTQKIPLTELDLPATTKANDYRGVDFRVPGANEGQ